MFSSAVSPVFVSGICNFIRGLNFGTKVCHSSVKHVPQVFAVLVKHKAVFVDNMSAQQTERSGSVPSHH